MQSLDTLGIDTLWSVKYRTYKGRRFRIVTTSLAAVPVDWAKEHYTVNWKKRESLRTAETVEWAKARPKKVMYAISTNDGWRYCFANVAPKHVKKWLDYFVARY